MIATAGTGTRCVWCDELDPPADHVCKHEIPMTQASKFPDEKAIKTVYGCLETYGISRKTSGNVLVAALTDYRTRTGIDLADVSEKLASGEWVLTKKRIVLAMDKSDIRSWSACTCGRTDETFAECDHPNCPCKPKP